MRRPTIIALILVLGLTLVVWGFSFFIQPFLPNGIFNVLSLFFIALVAVIGVLAGFPDIVDRFSGKKRLELNERQKLVNRRNMLQNVRNTWIEGVLYQSLYNEIRIELGMKTRPEAIEHPWDMVIQMPDKQPKQVPPGTTMMELFDNTNGALLILGEPGSGKTTMLLELARLAIERAQHDALQHIPVVFNLSSWTPKQPFAEWLVNELQRRYYIVQKVARMWVEGDELLLLLDGLDEVKSDNREECVKAINGFAAEHSISLAICSRRHEYEALKAHLKLHGAVIIQPLTEEQIEQTFLENGAGLAALVQLLERDPELLEFAKTPLILSIMIKTYRNASREYLAALEKISDYRKHIFDDYIEQMFKHRGAQQRYDPEKAKLWLAWLSSEIQRHGQTMLNVEDLKLDWSWVYGKKFGLTILRIQEEGAEIPGFITPIDKLSWSWKEALPGLIWGLGIGGTFGLSLGWNFGLSLGRNFALSLALIVGLGTGLSLGLFLGLMSGLSGLTVKERSLPGEGIRSTIKTIMFLMISGLILGLTYGLSIGLIYGLGTGLRNGLILGLVSGLILSWPQGGYFLINHFTSRAWLYRFGLIPRNLIDFLDYCTDLIFLRRVGGGYIFIHRMLMEHFAEMGRNVQVVPKNRTLFRIP